MISQLTARCISLASVIYIDIYLDIYLYEDKKKRKTYTVTALVHILGDEVVDDGGTSGDARGEGEEEGGEGEEELHIGGLFDEVSGLGIDWWLI